MFPNLIELNYSASIWKTEASCNQFANAQTATHGEVDYIK